MLIYTQLALYFKNSILTQVEFEIYTSRLSDHIDENEDSEANIKLKSKTGHGGASTLPLYKSQ